MCSDDILAMIVVAIGVFESVEANETADDASVDAFQDGGLCPVSICLKFFLSRDIQN